MRAKEFITENFADGKKPGRRGLAKRSGVNCKASVTQLRKVAKNSSGEKQRMAHWCANMKSGKKESVEEGKKKRKKKPRWAAYGPGPFGGYGYAAGYSGDSGGSMGEGWKEAEELFLPSIDSWVGVENVNGNVLIYVEEIKFNEDDAWLNFVYDLTNNKMVDYDVNHGYNGNYDYNSEDIQLAVDDVVDEVKKKYGSTWDEISDELHGGLSVDEGWKDTVAGLALGAGVAFSNPAAANVEKVVVSSGQTVYSIAKAFGTTPEVIQKINKLDKNFSIKPGQEIKVPKWPEVKKSDNKKPETKKEPVKKQLKIDASKTLTGTSHEAVLTQEARKAGINNPIELAALLAQCAHETHDFKSMVEYGGSLDFKKYDIRFAPKKAKELGNVKPGDGARYKGRGYIQLTGRDNYTRAGKALGLDLVNKPQLVEKPEIAAKVAVWFWKQRVQPNVNNFNDVTAVTKPINPGLKGLEDRKEAFVDFKKFKLAMR